MRTVKRRRGAITLLFALATVVYATRTKQSQGAFVRVPFDFRVPTVARLRQRWWNPDDHRIVTPQVFGIGWSLNLYQVLRRLGYVGKREEAPDEPEMAVE